MEGTRPASAVGPRLSVMMFLQFFVWGAWYVTVGNFIKAVGWDDGVVGWAYTVGPLAAIISPLFLGVVADRFFATERVLGVMHLLGAVTMFLVPIAATGENASPTLFTVLLLAHMLCYMPTLGLTNTLVFHNVTNQEKQFPIIRVFGTLGWIAANFVVSRMLGADKNETQFYITSVAAALLGVYSFTLPHTPPPAAGQRAKLADLLGLGSVGMMRSPSFAVFMICSTLICIPLAAYYSFAPIFVDAMEIENPAFQMSFGQWSEVGFMIVMPLFFAFLGVKWMLAVGMLAWVVRYGLFAGSADDGIYWMILGGILLHGICYDFFFVTGQIYVDKKAPVVLRGQAQGFLVLMTQGVGLLIGAQAAAGLVGAYTPSEADPLRKELQTINSQIDELPVDSPERGELETRKGSISREVNMLVDWKSVWLYPTVAAGAILLIFLALFRDNGPQHVETAAGRDVAHSPDQEAPA
ncbi:MAG: MFS transporter [Planctomycetaceae bacterium]